MVALCMFERREDARKVCEVLKGELYLGLAHIHFIVVGSTSPKPVTLLAPILSFP